MNKKQKLIITISLVISLSLICIGVGIAYLILSQDLTIPEYVINALRITWNTILSINVSFIPIKIINTLIASYRNVSNFKNDKLTKKQNKLIVNQLEIEISNILNSSMPEHVKKNEIQKLIKEMKNDKI